MRSQDGSKGVMIRKTHPGTGQAAFEKLVRITRREGLRGLWQRVESWMKVHVWYYGSTMVMYTIQPEQPLPAVDRSGFPQAALRLQAIAPEDTVALAELVRIYRIPAVPEGILQRMRQNERCYTCWIGEQMVAYVWILLGGAVKEYGQTLFTLHHDEVYIHDAYVLPAFRGRSLYPWMKAVASRDIAAATGKTKVISYIRRDNYPSLNASRKLDGLKTGHLGCLRLGKRRFWLHIPHRPAPL